MLEETTASPLDRKAIKPGVFLEMAGICHKYHVLRLALNGVGPKKTSRLIIKDLLFDGVPVRVYWPNATTTGTRRGMVYLHGGVGLIGSI
ncbi:Arylacetamide deacetylase-like 4, partial [Varanus komodoensis]